jgi:hypothetical protein
MIISLNRQFLFVHVHKCAGTSIEIALASHLAPNDLVIGSTPGGERLQSTIKQLIGLDKHSSARQALAWIGPERWEQFFTFAFVRHPLERLRSLYTYARGLADGQPMTTEEARRLKETGTWPSRLPYHYPAVRAAALSDSFDAFLCHPMSWKDVGTRPTWQSLCDADRRLLVNFVGKVESASADWTVIQEKLKLTAPLGIHNQSQRSQEITLSDAAWAQVKAHCLVDFQMFAYPLPAPLAN